MPRNWWFKFEFAKWRTDSDLRRCSLETRGFWVDVLCIMEDAEAFELSGTYEELARLIGCSANEVARCADELKRTDTADVMFVNGGVTLTSRKRKRDITSKEKNRLRVEKHRRNADVMAQSKSKSNREEIREEKEGEPQAVTPSRKLTKPKDARLEHPAIKSVLTVTGKYPLKDLWDAIIDIVGDTPNDALLKKCWIAWRGKGFSPTNFGWLFEWYVKGDIGDGNGTVKQFNSNKRHPEQVKQQSEAFFNKKFGLGG